MTPLRTDDDQLRRLDEMVRAMHESLILANEARHDKAAKIHSNDWKPNQACDGRTESFIPAGV